MHLHNPAIWDAQPILQSMYFAAPNPPWPLKGYLINPSAVRNLIKRRRRDHADFQVGKCGVLARWCILRSTLHYTFQNMKINSLNSVFPLSHPSTHWDVSWRPGCAITLAKSNASTCRTGSLGFRYWEVLLVSAFGRKRALFLTVGSCLEMLCRCFDRCYANQAADLSSKNFQDIHQLLRAAVQIPGVGQATVNLMLLNVVLAYLPQVQQFFK